MTYFKKFLKACYGPAAAAATTITITNINNNNNNNNNNINDNNNNVATSFQEIGQGFCEFPLRFTEGKSL